MRRVPLILIAALAATAAAAPASASRDARFGVQDNAWLMYGPGTLDQRLAILDELGVGIVRFTLRWDQVAPSEPAAQRDPADPAYHWGPFAQVLDGLHAHHIPVLVTIWGSPGWANGGHPPNWLPSHGFGNFAYAAARRFPWIHLWTVWNEPNTLRSADPVSPRLYTRRLLNPAYALLHRASSGNRVAGGVTSPRRTASGMSPLAFMIGMSRSHAHLDAYAQNPYPGSPRSTPFRSTCSHCETFTMARLPLIRTEVTKLFGPKPLWLTEYGYQTNPPDRLDGVPPARQASYVGEAGLRVWAQPGVTMLIHFLVRDDPTLAGWQSGFFTVHGSEKPSFRAFALPLAQVSRRGARTVLWGQVRPGSGRRPYVLQRWNGSRWVSVGGLRRTDLRGTFRRTTRARPGEKLRAWSPLTGFASPLLRVS